MSDCYLMPNEQFFNYIMARTSSIQWDDDGGFNLYKTNTLKFVFIVLAHTENNSPRVVMSLHSSDKLSWIRANRSLLLLLNNVYLEEKQPIPIL